MRSCIFHCFSSKELVFVEKILHRKMRSALDSNRVPILCMHFTVGLCLMSFFPNSMLSRRKYLSFLNLGQVLVGV